MMDPDVAFVRETEVFAAMAIRATPVRVYFLRYHNSAEEQQFFAALKREEAAFERLIRAKANMAVPRRASAAVEKAAEDAPLATRGVDAWGISMQDSRFSGSFGTLGKASSSRAAKLGRTAAGALGGVKDSGKRRVVVDIREFRSKLPSLLHVAGFEVVPLTLEVGDYVLSPTVCVERKSVPDLIGSLASGRLFTQCVAMSRCYEMAVLLVEFEGDRAFGLGAVASSAGITGGDDEVLYDIHSKLSLFALHFPKLRILWAQSPHATVDLFLAIKQNHDEPLPHMAAAAGTEAFGAIKADFDRSHGPGVPLSGAEVTPPRSTFAASVSSSTSGVMAGRDGGFASSSAASSAELAKQATAVAGSVTSAAQDAAMNVLRRVPGVTAGNVHNITRHVHSLAELATLSIEQLCAIVSDKAAARIFSFFHERVPAGSSHA